MKETDVRQSSIDFLYSCFLRKKLLFLLYQKYLIDRKIQVVRILNMAPSVLSRN
jgi:hypothetical protein